MDGWDVPSPSLTPRRGMFGGMAAIPAYLTATRTRDATVLGRLLGAARAAAPGVGRWLARSGRRVRTAALTVGGLGSISAAAWAVAVPLGLVAVGVSLLLVEYLSTPSEP